MIKSDTENIWQKNETESKYIPYYHRGEIGFQYIPPYSYTLQYIPI